MKIKQFFTLKLMLITTILLSCSGFSQAKQQSFAPELKIFEAYLGTWEAVFKEENGVPTVVDVSKWERALNGKALRTLHSINNGEYGGESIIFFDNKAGTLKFYYFTTADFYTQGRIEVLDNNTFVAYEKVTGESAMSQGISEVKSTSKSNGTEMIVETSYLKNGKWTKPDTRKYTRSDKEVLFK